jgi:ComF family protein
VLILNRIMRTTLDTILPERCHACGTITPSGGEFCVQCWEKVTYLLGASTGSVCTLCNIPLPEALGEENICAPCMQHSPRHDGIFAAVAYGDIARKIALRLKYGGKIGLAKMIARQLSRSIDSEFPSPILLVPVPLHWTRLWSRSYNQAALIASAFAANVDGMTHQPDALLRTKRTPYLRGMSAKQRAQTVRGAFAVNPKCVTMLRNADIILVDDIYTTGATTDACVRILKKAGARRVRIFCWARVIPGAVDVEYQSTDGFTSLDLAG